MIFIKPFKNKYFSTIYTTWKHLSSGKWKLGPLCGFILFCYFFQLFLDTIDIKLCRFKM